MSKHLDEPMSNVELRLSLADILSELAENKRITMETHEQAMKTNGRVNWLEKTAYVASGAMPLLAVWAGWLTLQVLNPPQILTATQIQAAVSQAVEQKLNN